MNKLGVIVRSSAVCCAVLAGGFATVLGQVAAPARHHYSYFKEQVPLGLDATRIAVFQRQDVAPAAARAASNGRLADFGISSQDVSLSAISRISMVALPLQHQSPDQVRILLAAVSQETELEFVSPVFLDDHDNPLLISRHIHVGFNQGVSDAQADAILARQIPGVIEERNYLKTAGVYRLRCDSRDGFEVLALANRLAALPEVAFAEPDMVLTARKHLIPNDPSFNSLWGIHNTGQSGGTADMDMDGPEAWDITTGDAGIIVAIMDDGVEQTHSDINQIAGVDFTGNGTGGGPFNSCDSHGTTVAGCVSAIINNSTAVVGIAPACMVAGVKYNISNVPCNGTGTFQTSWFSSGLQWAQDNGARVTNVSAGFLSSALITTKYTTTRNAGLVHFASSGNDGASSIGYPANLSTVNAVGAVNRNGNLASFSDTGTALDFVAPGQSITTTDRTGAAGFAPGLVVTVDGTSYSSPYAAGVAALVLSVDDSLTPDEVEEIMETTCKDRGDPGYDTDYGWGIVQAWDALLAVPSDDVTPPTPDPMTFATPPTAVSTSQITMTATTASDVDSPPVEYMFDFVSGGSGGTDSSFQPSTTYDDTGLAVNTSYTYRVKARDDALVPNETAFSSEASAATLAIVPSAPTVANPTSNSIDVNPNLNGNPSYTELALQCTSTDPFDAAWDGMYIDAGGNPSAAAVWQDDATWGAATAQGLQPETDYTFAVKARNLDLIETALGPGGTSTTAPAPCAMLGDVDGSGFLDAEDIAPYIRVKLGVPIPGDISTCADFGNNDLALDTNDFVFVLLL